MLRAIFGALCAVLLILSPSFAKKSSDERIPSVSLSNRVSPTDGPYVSDPRFAIAAANTTVLASYSFNIGQVCTEHAWTTVDATANNTVFWHVDDFAGANVHPSDNYTPLAGTRSLWCGIRGSPGTEGCQYLVPPGYGNNWDQAWQTKQCIPLNGTLDISFLMELDIEDDYDAAFLEYTNDCNADYVGWTLLAGGIGLWDGIQTISYSASHAVGPGPVTVRIRFRSDEGYSDEDGIYDSHGGPIVIDNLTAEGLAMETFEDEAVGATTSNDWEPVLHPGYGNYMALFHGNTLVQQDPCAKNLSCVWAAISGSTTNYGCAGFPQQLTVPYGDALGQYINNEIWSPAIPLTGTGGGITLRFSVYRDLALDQYVFYTWDVRSIINGCPGPWRSRGLAYFGAQKDWFTHTEAVGDLVDITSASHIQVRLAATDQCGRWCGFFPTCHSHAPLFDNVKIYRVDIAGPVWSTRDFDMFQDTFPVDGTDTGIGRADAALSITPSASPTILPGDSARVIVRDPITAVPVTNPSGLAPDNLGGNNGNKACYLYVNVSDNGVFNPAKSGAILSGGAQYPFKDTVVADGTSWTRIQCWLRITNSSIFVVDLNDNLFQAGDVVSFFFGAANTLGQTTYCSGSALNYVQSDLENAAKAASEFSILPVNGKRLADAEHLLIDGMDGRGGQEFWDIAFDQLNIDLDRYDIRGPTSKVSNGPGSRVIDVSQQLSANYAGIFWDIGDLSVGPGDGTENGKANDYGMLNSFLGGSNNGLYLCGDDLPTSLNTATGGSAVTFRTTFVPYSMTSTNHRPSYGIAPTGTGTSGNAFAGDTWVIYGGCPLLNDFDVMTPLGTTVIQSTYGANTGNNGAEISKITGTTRVMLSGYSFIYIRDDDADGVLDRARHLRSILVYLTLTPNQLVGTDPVVASNRLEQNYPNPFNPATTIAFSIKHAGQVRIDIYNVAGERVRTLVDERRAAGSYTDVRWDGTNDVNQPVASGVYWYRLVAGSYTEARKMVLLK